MFFVFYINKYLGIWYELAHYPFWFQRNDNIILPLNIPWSTMIQLKLTIH